jgi:hypothetical protein
MLTSLFLPKIELFYCVRSRDRYDLLAGAEFFRIACRDNRETGRVNLTLEYFVMHLTIFRPEFYAKYGGPKNSFSNLFQNGQKLLAIVQNGKTTQFWAKRVKLT